MCYITESAIEHIKEQDDKILNTCERCGEKVYNLEVVNYFDEKKNKEFTNSICDECISKVVCL